MEALGTMPLRTVVVDTFLTLNQICIVGDGKKCLISAGEMNQKSQ